MLVISHPETQLMSIPICFTSTSLVFRAKWFASAVCLLGLSLAITSTLNAQEIPAVIKAGAGSYSSVVPPGATRPPETIYRTGRCQGPMPTNDWWSSLAWEPLSSPMFPHPLAVHAQTGGLSVFIQARVLSPTFTEL